MPPSTQLLLTSCNHLAGRHHKRLKGRLSERGADRNIGSVTTPGDQDTADPRNVVAGVERVPAPADECLEPGAEIHRSRIRGHADISQIARAISRRDIHAPAKHDSEV